MPISASAAKAPCSRPARRERKKYIFPRNDRPYGLKRIAFQTENLYLGKGGIPPFPFLSHQAGGGAGPSDCLFPSSGKNCNSSDSFMFFLVFDGKKYLIIKVMTTLYTNTPTTKTSHIRKRKMREAGISFCVSREGFSLSVIEGKSKNSFSCLERFNFEKGETRGGYSAARPKVSGKTALFPRNDRP